ncbi:MAG: type II toxin-antitoxin system VapC family toxin [Treponema sp.]|nr:type II toxin-antitoxin system VapC family toxin [Treponema sp.]MCL2251699.1 type II toxin-antitoxin system VapC family toxin [Treponema sp.]
MNIIDSSFWLEYFAGTKAGDIVSNIVENIDELIVPTITLYEVFKKLLIERNEDDALMAVGHMKQGKVIDITEELSLSAAKISIKYKLPMADSIIYATNMKYNCILWTQDQHFSDLYSVNYFEKLT